MKNITIPALIFLSTLLNSAMFDNNTDVKSKYQFDVNKALADERLAAKLARFQNDEVSEEEIKNYLEESDDNKSAPFKDDVALDDSLRHSFPQKEKEEEWYEYVYNLIFADKPSVTEETVAQEETVASETETAAEEETVTPEAEIAAEEETVAPEAETVVQENEAVTQEVETEEQEEVPTAEEKTPEDNQNKGAE